MTYEYPPVSGYGWNLLQKISIALGVAENLIGISDNGEYTFIHINAEVTPSQKTQLDTIMASANPCGVPANTGNTTYRIADIWSMRQWFYDQIGIIPLFWFEQGNDDGSGECYMYLQFPRALTNTEKNKIVNTYTKMIGLWSM
jgi:hypothetical protein